jgi:hypothetical protein
MMSGEWMMVEPGGIIRLSEPLKQELSIVDGDMVFVVVKKPAKARSDAALAAINSESQDADPWDRDPWEWLP